MDSDFDSEDSNEEGYYDRICDAYGYEEDDHEYEMGSRLHYPNRNHLLRTYYDEEGEEGDEYDEYDEDFDQMDRDFYDNEFYGGYRDEFGDYREEDYREDGYWESEDDMDDMDDMDDRYGY